MPSDSAHRDFSPHQHAAVRLQIALIPAYVWLVYALFLTFNALPLGRHIASERPFRDFLHFYVLGSIANQHDATALYDMDAQRALAARLAPGNPDPLFPTSYGPQVALFFAPFARLSYIPALYCWLLMTLALYSGCGYLLFKACPYLDEHRSTVVALLAASPALFFVLAFAQTSGLALASLTIGFLALRDGRRFLAGLAIGSLAYKPQLGIAAAFVFILAAEWRIVLGAIGSIAVQFAVSAAFWGSSVLHAYGTALARIPQTFALIEPAKEQMHSWRSFFQLLAVPPGAIWLVTIAASLVTVFVALVCWRTRGPLAVRFSVLLIATVLVNPHMYVYDLLILTPVFLFVWDWSCEPEQSEAALGRVARWLIYFCYMSPVLFLVAAVTRVQLSVPALVALEALLAWRLMRPA